MDNFIISTDQICLFNRGPGSRIKHINSCQPRSPLNVKDLQIAPDGRQILLISSSRTQGVSFICLGKGQDQWRYHDFMPKNFTVTCGVFSPKSNHIVYLGTDDGTILQYDLKTKTESACTVLRKDDRKVSIASIDVNCSGSQLVASLGGSVLLLSLRSNVDSCLEYDSRPDARVMVKFHPTRQFVLGLFSLAEGASFMDLSSVQPVMPKTRIQPPPGEAHVCDPCALLWANTESLVTAATDGRVVQYCKRSSSQVYRHPGSIFSAEILRDGAEILLGLENTFACLDVRQKKVIWTKAIASQQPVKFIARAKSYLPVAQLTSGIEAMYPQKRPANPDIRAEFPPVVSAPSPSPDNLISPVRGEIKNIKQEKLILDLKPNTIGKKGERRRHSSIGLLISPPKSQTTGSVQDPPLILPQRRTLSVKNIKRESTTDGSRKENDTNTLQSTFVNDGESKTVDFGLDSTSPVHSLRPPLTSRQNQQSTPTSVLNERSLFCNVDSMRSSSRLQPESQSNPTTVNTSISVQLERQNALLTALLESSTRMESKISKLVDEVREQGASDRRLIGHSIELFKAYHHRTVDMLTEIADTQNFGWMEPLNTLNEKF